MQQNSPFRTGCQRKFWKQSWTIIIHQDEPITAERVLDYIAYLREQKIFKFQLTLYPRQTMTNTWYEEYRTYFDNFCPVVSHSLSPVSAYAIQSPVKPTTPLHVGQLQDNPFQEQWYQAIFERYDKNHKVGLNSVPVSRSTLPEGTKIIPSVATFKVKRQPQQHHYNLYYRMCLNRSKQEKGSTMMNHTHP